MNVKKVGVSALISLTFCFALVEGKNVIIKKDKDVKNKVEDVKKVKNAEIDLSKYDVLWNELKDVKPAKEKHFVVLIPSYNNSKCYKRNLDSIFMQKYSNFHILYIDDCSPDGTGDLVEKYIKEKHQEHRVILIKNKERRKAMANVYTGVLMCDDNDIIASCDGDDCWANDHVLSLLNKIYQDPNVWITHGKLMHWPQNKIVEQTQFPANVILKNKFRDYRWSASGLRSYYVWLFKKIKVEDFYYEGEFLPVCHDLAIMYPMFEMAGNRIKFIPDVLYIATRNTGINDFSAHVVLQQKVSRMLRKEKSRYTPLNK